MSVEKPLDRPTDLVGIVDYQTHAIVSHTLVKNPAGTVTLFAFDEGQELSEHTAPYEAILCVLEGTLDVKVGPTWHTLQSGQGLRLPANVPHAVRAAQRAKVLLVMIRYAEQEPQESQRS